MNFNGDFQNIGFFDISSLKDAVTAISEEEWAGSSWREKQYDIHKYTQTIQLVFDEDFKHSNPTYLPKYEELKPLLEPLTDLITRHYNNTLIAKRMLKKHGKGYLIRMILVRLAPGGGIPPHGDQGYSLMHSHRIHLPVISQGNTLFTVGDTTRKLNEGEVWEINNKRTHSVTNPGNSARVHIISDWIIPGERCCCGKNLHPKGKCGLEECYATDNSLEECGCYPH